ncbi:hypothetical protein F5884DRAFT_810952 [Xylogone sp. PMI_703]|nr:hypothetical protein F5884DRAFT_810952 [Xylogone sp. PMI_703]
MGLMLLLSGLIVVIIYYKMVYADTGLERFMDSQGFGVRFLFTAIGVIIKQYWSKVFESVAIVEAYRQLRKGSATAQNSILMSRYSEPVMAIPSSLLHGHFFIAVVAISAFLAEALTICLSNISFNVTTTYQAFTVSVWLSCAIIGVMLLALIFVAMRQQPDLPLKPNTIASVLCYLANSSLPDKFHGMALMDEKTRNRKVREMNLKYTLRNKSGSAVVTIDIET